jgi:HD-like signal output (HDOD) protein
MPKITCALLLAICFSFPVTASVTKQAAASTSDSKPPTAGRAERVTMGFTHCETGRALAEQWKLANDVVEVIAHHHAVEQSQKAQPLVAQVHLSDLPCRMRGLGYRYYERHKVDLVSDPAWAILLKRTPRP